MATLRESRRVLVDRWKTFSILTVLFFATAVLLQRFDPGWMEPIKAGRDESLVRWARGLSQWGEFHLVPLIGVAGLAAAGWIAGRRRWIQGALGGFLAGSAAGLTVMVLKVVFGRPRPHVGEPDGFYWFEFGANWASFPSGHTTHCFAFAVGLSLVLPRTWPITLVSAAAVAWSRYYLDRHYPTDLLMGFWMGTLWGIVFGLGARRALDGPAAATVSVPEKTSSPS